jgi:hypothetical protein
VGRASVAGREADVGFDVILHCTGSSSTQSGLITEAGEEEDLGEFQGPARQVVGVDFEVLGEGRVRSLDRGRAQRFSAWRRPPGPAG